MHDITTIVPATRLGPFKDCLAAVRETLDVSVRLIVVLGNDNPGLREIALHYGAEILEHFVPEDQHKARADALALVQTPFVHFLDDDDFIPPEFYRDGIKILRDDPSCDTVFALPFRIVGKNEYILESYHQFHTVNPSCTIYRTEGIRKVFADLPRALPSSGEDKLYMLVNAYLNRAKYRCFRAPISRGVFHTEDKIWDTLVNKETYDYWYAILQHIPPYQHDPVADLLLRYTLSESRLWYSRHVIYSLPVLQKVTKIRGSSGYRHCEPWPDKRLF